MVSLFDYKRSRKLEAQGEPFAALIMVAMRQADTLNAERLRQAFPDIAEELQARYDAPAGLLLGETDYDSGIRRTQDALVAADTGEVIRAL